MRAIITLLAVLSVGALSQAWATDPPAADATKSTPPATSSTPTPSAAPAATEHSAADKTSTAKATDGAKQVKLVAGDAAADARLKRLKSAGYRPKMHGEQLVFCRREPVMNSHFEHEVCGTAEDIEAQTANGQDIAETMRRTSLGNNPSGK